MQFLTSHTIISTGYHFIPLNLVGFKDLQLILLLNESRRYRGVNVKIVENHLLFLLKLYHVFIATFGILSCCRYCWRQMRMIQLPPQLPNYMTSRKLRNITSIFKNADNLYYLMGELKSEKKLQKIEIKIAIVNKNDMVSPSWRGLCFCCLRQPVRLQVAWWRVYRLRQRQWLLELRSSGTRKSVVLETTWRQLSGVQKRQHRQDICLWFRWKQLAFTGASFDQYL